MAVHHVVAIAPFACERLDHRRRRQGQQGADEAEERRRVLPVIEGLVARVQTPISIDTYKASVAGAALEVGAALINDVSGLRYEPALADVVARAGAPSAQAFSATCAGGQPALVQRPCRPFALCRSCALGRLGQPAAPARRPEPGPQGTVQA